MCVRVRERDTFKLFFLSVCARRIEGTTLARGHVSREENIRKKMKQRDKGTKARARACERDRKTSTSPLVATPTVSILTKPVMCNMKCWFERRTDSGDQNVIQCAGTRTERATGPGGTVLFDARELVN